MAHELTATDNMFSVREMPWHNLGVVLEDYPTRQQAQAIAHPWEPIAAPIYRATPQIIDGEPVTSYEPITEFVAQERSDNGGLLGVTTNTYTAVTNSEMYDVAEALQGENSDVLFETGGSLKGGAHVWLMLRLAEPLTVKGDTSATLHYYLLQNRHDAMGSFKGSATATRVVCANTLRMADMDARSRGTEFSFRHSSGITARVEEARAALAGWRESIEEWKAFTAHMADLRVTASGVEAFLERFIPEPHGQIITDRVRENIGIARAQWKDCYYGVTGEGITGTAYGLLQASSEYAEHYRKAINAETRFKRAILKPNEVMTMAIRYAEDAALV